MQAVVAERKTWISSGTVAVFIALLAALILGAASGYLLRALSVPISVPRQQIAVVGSGTTCPLGTHVVVWYTARTWACVSDESGQ